jgi:thioredoxin-like negative regulator of GroEL
MYDPKLLLNNKQLEEKAEDDPDFDDEDEFMKQWREKRMAEVQAEAAKPKFGSVYEIGKQDWEEHVTNAPPEANVVIHLYQNHITECKLLNDILNQLAAKYKDTKFIRSVATKSVENF